MERKIFHCNDCKNSNKKKLIKCKFCKSVFCRNCFLDSVICGPNVAKCKNCKNSFSMHELITQTSRNWVDSVFTKQLADIAFNVCSQSCRQDIKEAKAFLTISIF